jgi:carboxymethylenebutenolidase
MTTRRTESITAPDGHRFTTTVVLPDSGHGPGVLLLQEIFGVNDFLLGKAEDLAQLGYVVSCPDVFCRVTENLNLPHTAESLQEAFGHMGRYATEVDDGTKVADLVAALAHLRGLDATGARVAVMGYCLGGFLAYRVAAAGDPDACVSYYGSGIADHLGEAGAITCPVCFHFGAADDYIPQSQVDAIRGAFADRSDVEVHVWDGAGHAFENLLAPMFAVPEAAARSWPVTVDFLATRLS